MQSIIGTLQLFFVAFLFRVLLRNKWLAAAAFVAMFTILNLLGNPHSPIMVPVWLLVYSIAAYAVSRFGLITLAVAIFSATVLLNLPYTVDFTKWYATDVVLVLLSFVVIAGWAFYTSAGRNLFQKDFLQ